MGAQSAIAANVSLLLPRPKAFQAHVAPSHRKARILTRDPLREVAEAGDSMDSLVVGEEKRCVTISLWIMIRLCFHEGLFLCFLIACLIAVIMLVNELLENNTK